ncbi:MAG: hypothetical protein F6K04_02365 [Leptolyngbya sp. SIO4C5]|nr:hypothetical protein [Leptolyngbya sp. SIO4C5]
MPYRLARKLPLRWRQPAIRWLCINEVRWRLRFSRFRPTWLSLWNQPPIMHFTAAFAVPFIGILTLATLVILRDVLFWFLVAYGVFLLMTGAARFIYLLTR